MLKEKNPLLKLNLKKEKSILSKIINFTFEALYGIFDFILDNPIENFWYECINILISYFQLITLMLDDTVSQFKNKDFYIILLIIYIVYDNLEPK